MDERKEAADIRRAEECGRHRGTLSIHKTGQCWRNRQKIGKERGDTEIKKSNKLINQKPGFNESHRAEHGTNTQSK